MSAEYVFDKSLVDATWQAVLLVCVIWLIDDSFCSRAADRASFD